MVQFDWYFLKWVAQPSTRNYDLNPLKSDSLQRSKIVTPEIPEGKQFPWVDVKEPINAKNRPMRPIKVEVVDLQCVGRWRFDRFLFFFEIYPPWN